MLRGIYGLLQSGRNFWLSLIEELLAFGFETLTSDECCFRYSEGSEVIIIITVVDDLIQTGNSKRLLDKVLAHLGKRFKMTDDGEMDWFLGVAYSRQQDGSILANQTAYIRKCLEKFKLTDIPVKHTPMALNLIIDPSGTSTDPETLTYYRALIGSLIYLVTWTRPDIAHAINYLA